MINSGNFSFAHLTLDANSIQLSGRNNRGKTSLLWTLPLLFVVDRKQATHPKHTPKESLNFYFRNQDKSYIIFEGYDEKQGYFYMLLRREGDSVKYHFVKKKFDRSMFMEYDDRTQTYTVLPFSRVLENPATGIGAPLKDHREVLSRAITSKKGEVAFLRLAHQSKSRQFSDLYKHLFRSGGDSQILKNGILIVNGLQEEALSMRDELSPSELAEWRREQEEIDTLKEIREDLADLKEKRNVLESKRAALISSLSEFGKIDFNKVRQSVNAEHETYKKLISELDATMDSLKEEEKSVRGRISGLDEQRGSLRSKIEQLQQNIETIEGYQDKAWLEQALRNLEKEKDEVRDLIRNIDTVASIGEVERKLSRFNARKREIEQFIDNHENTLLMNLANNKEEIAVLNTVLSDAVTSLPKSAILSGMDESRDDTFAYNGAKIDISSLEIREIPTLEERKSELEEVVHEIEKILSVKENYNKREKLETEKRRLEAEIQAVRNRLDGRLKLEGYRRDLALLEDELAQILDKRKSEEENERSVASRQKEVRRRIEETGSRQKSLLVKEKAIGEFYNRYMDYCTDAGFSPSPGETPSIDTLGSMIEQMQKTVEGKYSEFTTASEVYRMSEEAIKRHTARINLYDEDPGQQDDLLSLIEQKCEHIDVKDKELRDRVVARTNIFKGRVKRFLEQLEAVRKFTGRINNLLSKYTISDLSGVKVNFVPNERQIEEIEMLGSDNTSLFSPGIYDADSSNETIFRYIRTEKTTLLSDLFDIVVERTKRDSDTKREKREKSEQSNGTERMLRVMLPLILMRELIHPDDTIPFLIDEVMDIDDINQNELLKFFDELNLLPISASPQVAHTFEKVYYIEEDPGGKSYINDNTCTRKERREGQDAAA